MIPDCCKVCATKFSGFNSRMYVNHMMCHRNVYNCVFECCENGCNMVYSKCTALQTHYRRKHSVSYTTSLSHSIERIPVTLNLQCCVSSCKKRSNDYDSLLKHLKTHMDSGTSVKCPYLGCDRDYFKTSSMTSHLSRCHKIPTQCQHVSNNILSGENELPLLSYALQSHSTGLPLADNDSIAEDEETSLQAAFDDTQINKSLGLCLLALEGRYLVPRKTIQFIVEELSSLTSMRSEILSMQLRDKLGQLGVPNACAKQVLELVEDRSCYGNLHTFRSVYSRTQYFQQEFCYVAPEPLYLGKTVQGESHVFYVPLKNSLTALLTNKSVWKAVNCGNWNETVETHSAEAACNGLLLRDFTDGQKYREAASPDELQIILFQDAFEIANPIGSSRTKHKLLGVYGMIGNIPPKYRSAVDTIFLVMLMKESFLKQFGQNAVFGRLLKDLTEIELTGVPVNDKILKGRLFAILGDNLGSHSIGGFTENFLTEFFCRYCMVQKASFQLVPYECGADRTVEAYKESVSFLEENPSMKAHKGVKSDSAFNSLHHFHVCDYGLPPCIGHDLFEGVVAYDMVLIIRALVGMRWFSYELLNERICTFQYQADDLLNKPPTVSKKAMRLSGQAMQNWCLLRLFPLFIFDRVNDDTEKVWQLCIMLREVVELVCAPALSSSQVAWIEACISQYLHMRKLVFPNEHLKPKHHFMVHYAQLTYKLGPLIRLWTMRFESKHSYFKRCIRSSHNFKNPAKSLSYHHQLNMAYILCGEILKPQLHYSRGEKLMPELYSGDIQRLLLTVGITGENSVSVKLAKEFGVTYRMNMYLFCGTSMQGLQLGHISMMIVKDKSSLYFVIQKACARHIPSMGVYELQAANPQSASVNIISSKCVFDYHPLVEYLVDTHRLVVLKHSFIDC